MKSVYFFKINVLYFFNLHGGQATFFFVCIAWFFVFIAWVIFILHTCITGDFYLRLYFVVKRERVL